MTFVVVGNDAGGSELLCAFIKENFTQASWHIFAQDSSPMQTIAQRESLHVNPIKNIKNQLENLPFDALLFATGWQEKPEREFVEFAKNHNIASFAFLDHWSNYRERFGFPEKNWKKNLPDFTVTHDKKSLQLAKELALPSPIAVENFYLKKIVQDTKVQKKLSTLLFLGEPTDKVAKAHYNDENYWGFTQYTALEMICDNFEKFECASLSIRLHPSEKSSAYKKILKKYPHIKSRINEASVFELSAQIMQAKMIIGFDTMALYIAAHLNKALVSFLPSQKREFLLPLPKSHQISKLSQLKKFHLQPLHLKEENFGIDFALFKQLIKEFK